MHYRPNVHRMPAPAIRSRSFTSPKAKAPRLARNLAPASARRKLPVNDDVPASASR